MQIQVHDIPIERRRLALRDSLRILALLLATAALFLATLFLFRSFSAHRDELAKRWSARGSAALAAGKPEEAITALRTALIYAPGDRQDELLLAEALGQTGSAADAEASYQYFMNLWAAEPGYGPINLQLARLARKRNRPQDAISSYRAAIYGNWDDGGVQQRAETRLELAQYLIEQHDAKAAQIELLIAAGDSEETYGRDMQIGSLLEQAGDADDAASYYRRALKLQPRDAAARDAVDRLEAAAQAAKAEAAAAQANEAAQDAATDTKAGDTRTPTKLSRRGHER